MTQKTFENQEYLVKELDSTYQQLKLFRTNNADKELPKKLAGKIAYLRGYARALKCQQNNKNESGISLYNLAKRIQLEWFGPSGKHK